MSNFSNRLLVLALLSAFAATTASSAVAAEKERGKDKQRATEHEHERSGKKHHDDKEHHDGKKHSEHDHDETVTLKTSVVTVTNSGGAPLKITAAPFITLLSGKGNFALVPPATGTPCVASLVVAAGGGKCTIGVQYTPSVGDEGKSTARLTLTDSGAATTTQEVVLRSDD